MQNKAIIITGATCSGKSSYALEYACQNNGVIINADSMQVYNTFPVLSAQPSLEDFKITEHRLYSFLNYMDSYSIKQWLEDVSFNIYDVLKQENLNWSVNFNASKFERRIDEIAGGVPIFVGNIGVGTESQIMQEGYTPNSFYVFKQLYNSNGMPIEGAFADLNGDGIVNNSDRYIYKNVDPDLILGFSTTFNYKKFDLGFNLRASFGNRILNVVKSMISF